MKTDIHDLTTFKLAVEEDDHEKGCFMVTIRYECRGPQLRVPLRGVSKSEALFAIAPLHYAFEFGMAAYSEIAKNVRFTITRNTN
jgi:hypothetical protein